MPPILRRILRIDAARPELQSPPLGPLISAISAPFSAASAEARAASLSPAGGAAAACVSAPGMPPCVP
eukprot:16438998-Heterocapsa_arctica.AAC.1